MPQEIPTPAGAGAPQTGPPQGTPYPNLAPTLPKQEIPAIAIGLPMLPADPKKMPLPPQIPAGGLVIQIAINQELYSGEAMTMVQGTGLPTSSDMCKPLSPLLPFSGRRCHAL